MLIFKKITIRNLLSMGNVPQIIDLNNTGLTLILGNPDSNNGTKNGVGKSTIIQALSFALYGWPITQIKIDNLINNINQKGLLVTVDFEKDGIEYRIERGRKPNILRFYMNDTDVEDLARGENKETQTEIDNVIGMGYTLFQHTVALNTFNEPFLKLGAKPQREVIEELLGIAQLSQKADNLKILINVTKDKLKIEEASIKANIEINQRINNTIKTAENNSSNWQKSKNTRLEDLRSQINLFNDVDYDVELTNLQKVQEYHDARTGLLKRRADVNADKSHIEREIEQLRSLLSDNTRRHQHGMDKQVLSLGGDIQHKKKEIEANQTKLSVLEEKIKTKNAELNDPDHLNCKTCGQGLDGTHHLEYVVRRLTEDRDAFVRDHQMIQERNTNLAQAIDANTQETDRLTNEMETLLKTLLEEEASITQQANVKKTMLATMTDIITEIDTELSKLSEPQAMFSSKEELIEARHARAMLETEITREEATIDPYLGQIETLRSTLRPIDMTEIETLTEDLKHQDCLFGLLTRKDSFIRRKIIEQNISNLNRRLNYYLLKLGLPHEVVFESDLSVDISLLGRNMDFGQLSRGEGNRLNIATSWAFRDVWEILNQRINILFCDEIIDSGLDTYGSEMALSILLDFSRNQRNVFLISHKEELVGRVDDILLVTKENGFTTIESQCLD